jgi:23S rRNA-/tRNA-specific pseudouridylate synthase
LASLPPRKTEHDSKHEPSDNIRNAPSSYPPLKILYQDENYVAVDKPADLRITGDFNFTVQDMLAKRFPNMPYPHPCHQLDYATSGVMLWAFNSAAAKRAGACFFARTAVKHYIAIVDGHFPGATAAPPRTGILPRIHRCCQTTLFFSLPRKCRRYSLCSCRCFIRISSFHSRS